jgi:hypothetical protein
MYIISFDDITASPDFVELEETTLYVCAIAFVMLKQPGIPYLE